MARKKKAWNSTNPLYRYLQSKKSKSRRVKSSGGTMAKRRYAKKRSSSTNSNLLLTVGASMLYGGVRSKLSSLTSQYLPAFAGQYTDEVALGALGWYLSKKGGVIGQIGKSALIIESASVGNQLIGGMLNSTAVTTSTSSKFYV